MKHEVIFTSRVLSAFLVIIMVAAGMGVVLFFMGGNAAGTGANDDPSGAIWMERDENYGGLIGDSTNDPIDWWKFNGTSGATEDIQLWMDQSKYSSPQVTISLYGPNSSTNLIASDDTDEYTDSSEYDYPEDEFGLHIHETLPADGVYYVKVSTTASQQMDYYLHTDANLAGQITLPAQIHNDLDSHLDAYDWYYFTMDSAGEVNLTMTMEDSNTDFDLYLYYSNGTLIDSSTNGVGKEENIQASLPDAGNYFIKCLAYETGGYNYGNYTLTASIGSQTLYPDLIVQSITPSSAQSNQSTTYTAVVKNIGQAQASAPIDVAFYIDGSATPYTYSRISSALAPSGTASVSFSYTFTSVGTHTIDANVDHNGNITESNEGNNILSQQVSVSQTGEADDSPAGATELQPTDSASGTVDESTDPNDWYKVHITSTGTLNITLSFNSSAGDLDLYLYTSSDQTNSVAQSTTIVEPEEISYTVSTPDYYYIKVYAYSGSSMSYTLDIQFTAQTVTPDLEPTSMTPLTAAPGTPVTYNITVQNNGYTSGSFYVEVYIDSVTSPSKTYSDQISSIPTGGIRYVTFSHTFMTAGQHPVFVFVDSNNDVAESVESNNWLNVTVTVSGQMDDSVPEGANDMQLNTTVSDNITGSTDDIDYYKVYVPSAGQLNINLSWSSSSYDLDMYLYYEGDINTSVDQSTSSYTNWESISYGVSTNDTGYYYIKIKDWQLSDGTTVPYQLTVNFQPSSPGSAPDLTVTSITPTTAVVNTTFSYSVTVSNPTSNAISSPFTVAVFYDSDSTPGGSVSVPSLGAQSQTSISFQTVFGTVGQHKIKAVADYGDSIMETNENNNEYSQTITVDPQGSNQPPSAVIASPASGSTFTTDDSITFSSAGSSDPDGDTLIFTWSSSIDGQLGTGATIQTKLTQGQHIITLTVDDNKGGVAHASINLTVTPAAGNNPPTITITKPDANGDTADSVYLIVWTYSDPDGDNCTVSLAYDSDNDPSSYTLIISDLDASRNSFKWDTSVVPSGDYYIFARIVDSKGSAYSTYSSGQVHVSHNTPPSVRIIEPDGKDDEASDTYTIKWTANDAEQGTDLSISLYYAKHDNSSIEVPIAEDIDNTGTYDWDVSSVPEGRYTIHLVADDGKGGISDDYSKGYVTITHNSPPTVPGGIKPDRTHDLRPKISWSPSTDPDGDTVFYHVTVKQANNTILVNDMLVYQTELVMPKPLSYGDAGLSNRYEIIIVAEDSRGLKSQPLYTNLTVENTPPEKPQLQITQNPTAGNILTCTVLQGTDPDGDAVKFKYEWFRNGKAMTLNPEFRTKQSSDVLASMIVKGDTWKCVVTPWDGFAEGESAEVTVTIGNSPPTARISEPTDGKTYSTQNITLDASASSDVDKNDELTYTWSDDIDGDLGTGVVKDVSLSPGWHNITLTVSDGNLTSTATVNIHISTYSLEIVEGSVYTDPTDLIAGQAAKVMATVRNTGDADAPSVTIVMLDNNMEVERKNIGRLNAGKSQVVQIDWMPASGSHTILLYIMGNPEDGKGGFTGSQSIDVSVEKKSDVSTSSSASSSSSGLWIWLLIIILVIIIVIVIILILIQKPKKRKGKRKPTKVKPYQEAGNAMVNPGEAPQAAYGPDMGYYQSYPDEHPYQTDPNYLAGAAAYDGSGSTEGQGGAYLPADATPTMEPGPDTPRLETEEHPRLMPNEEDMPQQSDSMDEDPDVDSVFSLPDETDVSQENSSALLDDDSELDIPDEEQEELDIPEHEQKEIKDIFGGEQ